jgi:hypothetical protein
LVADRVDFDRAVFYFLSSLKNKKPARLSGLCV